MRKHDQVAKAPKSPNIGNSKSSRDRTHLGVVLWIQTLLSVSKGRWYYRSLIDVEAFFKNIYIFLTSFRFVPFVDK